MPQREGYENVVSLTIGLCLTYTLCIACIRVWIRKGAFGLDDVVIAIATILTLCNAATSLLSRAKGLGLPWSSLKDSETLHELNEASVAGVVTFVIALYLSKCAMLSFLSRITKTPSQIKLYWVFNGFIAVLGLVSALIGTVGCPSASGYYWAFHANRSSCPTQSARWQAITGLDVLTEIVLLCLPIHLVWGLQMPLRKKAILLVAFYLRLPVLGFSIARNFYTMQLRLPKTNPGLGSALVVIWMEVELAYALAASTLSALKAFTESFNSDFGLGFTRGKGDGSYGMSNVSGGSRQSGRLEKSVSPASLEGGAAISRTDSCVPNSSKATHEVQVTRVLTPAELGAEESLKLRPDTELKTFTKVTADPVLGDHGPWRENSIPRSDSSSGDDLVIVRETAYEVQHDKAPMLHEQRPYQ